jgi:hypothetical protein
MKTIKIYILAIALSLSFTSIGQKYTKFFAVKISNILGTGLEEYASVYNNNLSRDGYLDYCAFERANYFTSVLESTSKARKMSIWGCGQEIPRGKQAQKSHDELFGNSDFFIKPNVSYVKVFRNFEEHNLKIQSEIMIPTFWENEYTERKSPETIIKKSIADFSNKTGTFGGDLLECYKGSKDHHSVIIKYGKGRFGISTIILIEEEKLEKVWKYSVVIYNVVVFSKPMN